jgi:glycosyltransferase 2 family protein
MTSKQRGFLIRVGLSALALVLVVRLVSGRELLDVLRQADPRLLLAAVGVSVVDRLLMAWKWRMLLGGLGVVRGLGEVIRIYFIGTFYGSFLPTGVGGDVIRVVQVGGGREEMGAATASVIMERALGMLASSVLVLGCLLFLVERDWPELEHLLIGVGITFALGLAGLIWILHGRLPARFERITLVFRRYAQQPGLLGRFFALTFIEQFLPVVTMYAIGRALGLPVAFTTFLMVIPVTLFFARIPISIDGLGVTEGLYVLLFAKAGLGPTQSFLLALVGRAVTVCSVLPGVFFGRRAPAKESAANAGGGPALP